MPDPITDDHTPRSSPRLAHREPTSPVETLTDDSGNAVATYGYTAYGNADDSEYTGIDRPEAGSPEDVEAYNAYRYNSKRWDVGSETYDMGFRDYAPGLNRFTTRDMYNGALSDMGLGASPYTSNRYAFGAGNPISMIEMDGHLPCAEGIADTCGDPTPLQAAMGGSSTQSSGGQPASDLSLLGSLAGGEDPSLLTFAGVVQSNGSGTAVTAAVLDAVVTSTVNFGIDTYHAFQDPSLFFDYWGGPQQWLDQVALEAVGFVGVGKLAGLGVDAASTGTKAITRGAGSSGHAYAARVLPGSRPDGQTVFAGHGTYSWGAGDTIVPEGTTVHVYSELGEGISDSFGRAIETGGTAAPVGIFGPGSAIPNYTLRSPDNLTIYSGSTTVDSSTPLSTLLQPNMGVCHWAACTKTR